jgi:hypothetical protein
MTNAPANMNTNENATESRNAVEALRFRVKTNFFCMKKFTTIPIKAEQSSAQKTGRIYLKSNVNDRKSSPVPKRDVVANFTIEKPVCFMFFKSFTMLGIKPIDKSELKTLV